MSGYSKVFHLPFEWFWCVFMRSAALNAHFVDLSAKTTMTKIQKKRKTIIEMPQMSARKSERERKKRWEKCYRCNTEMCTDCGFNLCSSSSKKWITIKTVAAGQLACCKRVEESHWATRCHMPHAIISPLPNPPNGMAPITKVLPSAEGKTFFSHCAGTCKCRRVLLAITASVSPCHAPLLTHSTPPCNSTLLAQLKLLPCQLQELSRLSRRLALLEHYIGN